MDPGDQEELTPKNEPPSPSPNISRVGSVAKNIFDKCLSANPRWKNVTWGSISSFWKPYVVVPIVSVSFAPSSLHPAN